MELKNYILHSPIDLVDCVIDEVALEGLDGITLEGLLLFYLNLMNSKKYLTFHAPKVFNISTNKICIIDELLIELKAYKD